MRSMKEEEVKALARLLAEFPATQRLELELNGPKECHGLSRLADILGDGARPVLVPALETLVVRVKTGLRAGHGLADIVEFRESDERVKALKELVLEGCMSSEEDPELWDDDLRNELHAVGSLRITAILLP